jgi:hypothetical protein
VIEVVGLIPLHRPEREFFKNNFMQPSEVVELLLGTPVWVWIVRFAKGKWWPGVVQSVTVTAGLPQLAVRFECRAPERGKSRPPVFVGISTTRMRFLERRDLKMKGDDRPTYVPVPLLRVPETPLRKVTVNLGTLP